MEGIDFIPLFGSLIERGLNEYKGTLILYYSLKTSKFHCPKKLGGVGVYIIGFNEFF